MKYHLQISTAKLSMRIVSFEEHNDYAAMGIAAKFCTADQVGVELLEGEGRPVACWFWSIDKEAAIQSRDYTQQGGTHE